MSVAKNNESKQQVTLQIMECEPFLPSSRVNCIHKSKEHLQLQSTVCTLSLSIPQITHGLTCTSMISIYYSFVNAQPQSTHNYTCDWNQLSLLFPTRTYQYAGNFLLLRHGSSFNTGPQVNHNTKSTMPNIYNLYKNSTSPYQPPQDENR